MDQISAFAREPRPPLPWGEGLRIALFAGSRPNEVRRLLPDVLAGAALAEKGLGPCSFLLPAPDEARAADIREGLARARLRPSDARVVVVRLTPAGEALRPAFDAISRRFVRFLYAGLSREEAETLERLLGKTLSGTSAKRTSNLERRRSRL